MPEAASGLGQVELAEPAILAEPIVTHMLCLLRGYTRKEPFANGVWTPKAENWNGRTAMIGFTGIVLTEALAGKSVLEVSCQLSAAVDDASVWLALPASASSCCMVLNGIWSQCYGACAQNK